MKKKRDLIYFNNPKSSNDSVFLGASGPGETIISVLTFISFFNSSIIRSRFDISYFNFSIVSDNNIFLSTNICTSAR